MENDRKKADLKAYDDRVYQRIFYQFIFDKNSLGDELKENNKIISARERFPT
ncbi:MAG: hypothetical protein AAF171_06355 [Cyanobacteria bacterium P01_A01_bin.116]